MCCAPGTVFARPRPARRRRRARRIDTHEDTLAVAVSDPVGRPLVVTDLANTGAGFDELEALPAEHCGNRIGIEGSGNYGR